MSEWNTHHWTFIGGGNMTEAMLRGALEAGLPATHVTVIDPSDDRRELMREDLGVIAVKQIGEWHQDSVIVLAVKPQILDEVLEYLPSWDDERLVISVVAGVSAGHIRARLPGAGRLVRVMPNTPALAGKGAAGMAAGPGSVLDDLATTRGFLEGSGVVVEVEEKQLHAITALSGSGPAYFFLMVEAMTEAGVAQGLSAPEAAKLAAATCAGAGALLEQTGLPAAQLRARVTSKGGTTAAAVASFEDQGLRDIVSRAMKAAADRSRELMGDG